MFVISSAFHVDMHVLNYLFSTGVHSWHPGSSSNKHWHSRQRRPVTQGESTGSGLWLATSVLQNPSVECFGLLCGSLWWGPIKRGIYNLWGSDENRWQRPQMAPPVCGHSPSQRLESNFLVAFMSVWFGFVNFAPSRSPLFPIHLLQVRLRQQVLTCARCLARSQEMQLPRPGWVWWRPWSRSTAVQLAGSADWLRRIRPV